MAYDPGHKGGEDNIIEDMPDCQDLDPEKGPCDRSTEDRSKPGAYAAYDKFLAVLTIKSEDGGKYRGEARSDLGSRPFFPGRASGRNGHYGCNQFYRDRHGVYFAIALVNRLYNFLCTVPFGLWSHVFNQKR